MGAHAPVRSRPLPVQADGRACAPQALPYEEDERDTAVLKAVLPLMSRHAAGYHPISYTVWYEYAKDARSVLHRRVDEELARTDRLSPAVTYALYARHLVEPAEQALINARSGLLDLVGRVQDAVRSANAETTGFDRQLEGFQRDLTTASSLEDLTGPVHAMLEQTQRVQEGWTRLTSNLEQSQGEVQRLTDELNRLREEALTDTLSGLLNRRGLDLEIERLAALRSAAAPGPVVMMFDIDLFKDINDKYGHLLGDAVIAAVARVIRDTVGEKGVAARYGGEEFAVVLRAGAPALARDLAESIRVTVEMGKIRHREGADAIGGVTISGGIAQCGAGEDLHAALERADRALYTSKKNGRNRISVAD